MDDLLILIYGRWWDGNDDSRGARNSNSPGRRSPDAYAKISFRRSLGCDGVAAQVDTVECRWIEGVTTPLTATNHRIRPVFNGSIFLHVRGNNATLILRWYHIGSEVRTYTSVDDILVVGSLNSVKIVRPWRKRLDSRGFALSWVSCDLTRVSSDVDICINSFCGNASSNILLSTFFLFDKLEILDRGWGYRCMHLYNVCYLKGKWTAPQRKSERRGIEVYRG